MLVISEIDPKGMPRRVKAIRSQDGESLIVETPDGMKIDWPYDSLVNEAIPLYKPQ